MEHILLFTGNRTVKRRLLQVAREIWYASMTHSLIGEFYICGDARSTTMDLVSSIFRCLMKLLFGWHFFSMLKNVDGSGGHVTMGMPHTIFEKHAENQNVIYLVSL